MRRAELVYKRLGGIDAFSSKILFCWPSIWLVMSDTKTLRVNL